MIFLNYQDGTTQLLFSEEDRQAMKLTEEEIKNERDALVKLLCEIFNIPPSKLGKIKEDY